MENLKLVAFLLICGISESSTQSLPCHTASGDNCTSSICPNTVVTYTCNIINGTAVGLTDWTLPTGTCTTNFVRDKIRLSQSVILACQAVVTSTCGPYTASSLPPSDSTNCLSSILTVNITAAMNGSTVTCSNTQQSIPSTTTIVSLATINVVGLPGRPNVVANTIGADMILVVVNPSSSGGLPTSYSVTISNSSYVYSNFTLAFLNVVTFTGLTNSTTYTISAVAINCAGSSNTTTIYVSWAAPTPSPSTSSASITSTTSPTPKPTPTPDIIIVAIIGGVVGAVIVVIVVVVVVVVLIYLYKKSTKNKQPHVQVQLVPQQPMPPPRDPIVTPQAPSVPAEESLYDGSTQNQRVPEESLYDGRVDLDGNVPTGRGGNAQEALYSQPDTSKKNADKMTYATVQVAPATRNPPSERAGRRMPPPPNTSQQQDVFYSTVKT